MTKYLSHCCIIIFAYSMKYTKQLKQESGSEVILYIQAEAVFLAMLQCVGSAFDCGEKQEKVCCTGMIRSFKLILELLSNTYLPLPNSVVCTSTNS